MSRVRQRRAVRSPKARETLRRELDRTLLEGMAAWDPGAADLTATCDVAGYIAGLGDVRSAAAAAQQMLGLIGSMRGAEDMSAIAAGELAHLASPAEIANLVAASRDAAIDRSALGDAVESAKAALTNAGLVASTVERLPDGSSRITARTADLLQSAEIVVKSTDSGTFIETDVDTPGHAVHPLHSRAGDPCQPSIDLSDQIQAELGSAARYRDLDISPEETLDPPLRARPRKKRREERDVLRRGEAR